MSDRDDTILLVGWFNGDEEDPEIVFRPPVEKEDQVFGNTIENSEESSDYELVHITIKRLPNHPRSKGKSPSFKKVSRNLRDLVYSTQKLKKIIK